MPSVNGINHGDIPWIGIFGAPGGEQKEYQQSNRERGWIDEKKVIAAGHICVDMTPVFRGRKVDRIEVERPAGDVKDSQPILPDCGRIKTSDDEQSERKEGR